MTSSNENSTTFARFVEICSEYFEESLYREVGDIEYAHFKVGG
jgi:hypothetical protein